MLTGSRFSLRDGFGIVYKHLMDIGTLVLILIDYDTRIQALRNKTAAIRDRNLPSR